MQPSLTRTYRYFFGLAALNEERFQPPLEPDQVSITKAVEYALMAQLTAVSGGGYRSGPVYGVRSDARLTITHATVGGYWLSPAAGKEQVYRMDPGYMLGWNDALQATLKNDPVEWVGHWVVFPPGRRGTLDEQEELMQRAIELGLVDQHHVLVFVLFSEGHQLLEVWTCPDSDETGSAPRSPEQQ